jgi:hypothetical protein
VCLLWRPGIELQRACNSRTRTDVSSDVCHTQRVTHTAHLIQWRSNEDGMAAQPGTSSRGPSSAARREAAASAAPASLPRDCRVVAG